MRRPALVAFIVVAGCVAAGPATADAPKRFDRNWVHTPGRPRTYVNWHETLSKTSNKAGDVLTVHGTATFLRSKNAPVTRTPICVTLTMSALGRDAAAISKTEAQTVSVTSKVGVDAKGPSANVGSGMSDTEGTTTTYDVGRKGELSVTSCAKNPSRDKEGRLFAFSFDLDFDADHITGYRQQMTATWQESRPWNISHTARVPV